LTVLQKLYPNGPAKFKSPKQEEAINCITSGQAEVIAILGTGEGKSLLFILPSCLPYAVWDRYNDEREYIGEPLLFVSVESTPSGRFRSLLGRLDAAESLDRVVFDESHVILTLRRMETKSGQAQTQFIIQATRTLRDRGVRVVYRWIPSHEGVKGNEMADQAAKRAAYDIILGMNWLKQSHAVWDFTQSTLTILNGCKKASRIKMKKYFDLTFDGCAESGLNVIVPHCSEYDHESTNQVNHQSSIINHHTEEEFQRNHSRDHGKTLDRPGRPPS
jgi:RNase H